MQKTFVMGNFLLVFIIFALMLAGCGQSPYQDLQTKIATVDSLLIKARQAGATNVDSLRNEQKKLAEKYIANLDPAQVPATDLFAAAQLYYFAERYDLSVQVMERKDPEQASLEFNDLFFQVLCMENQIDKADTLFQQYILPDSPPALENYYDYLEWGYIENARYEQALKVVDNAIEALGPEFTVSLQLDKAELYYTLGEVQNALDIIKTLEKQKGLTDKEQKKLAAKRQLFSLVGNPAPELYVDEWLGSEPVTLAQLKGRVVLLDFWAPWCPPCRAMLPFIQQLYMDYHDQGLDVIGVTQYYGRFNRLGQDLKNIPPKEEKEWIIKFKESMNITVPTALSMPERGVKNAADYGVYGIPHFVLIDRQGKVRYYAIGSGESSEDTLKNGVIELLAEHL